MTHTNRMNPSTAVAPEGAWFKSSYSDENAANCVEVADLNTRVGIRDSKDKGLPALVVSPEAFSAFVASVRA